MKKLLIFLFLVSVFLSKINASPILAQSCVVTRMNSQSSGDSVFIFGKCNSRDYGRAALLIDGGVMGAYPDPKDGQESYITLKRKDLEGKLQGKTSFVAEIKCQYKSGLRWQTDSSCSDSFSLSGSSPITPATVDTGLGPIPTDPGGLVAWFLSVATKIAGGVALLLLAYGGIKIITSGGDPKAMDEAKATITSALSGLFLIIFAVLLLKVIGYDILRLPGWGTTPPAGDLILPQ